MIAQDSRRRAVIVVAGPTASGKSALGLDLAAEMNGAVLNADSMQVYRELHLLTARPGPSDIAHVPHSLYGMLPGREVCSAGRWVEMAAAEIAACRAAGLLPVVVGGTGLYISALIDGLSPIPAIPDDVRSRCRALMEEIGNARYHALLAERDPESAERLHPGNTQRLIRALEVLEATGRSITDWQREPNRRIVDADFHTILLAPPRETLNAAIDRRFDVMMEYGALAEVRALDAQGLPEDAPIMKALGVPELRAHLHGDCSLAEAVSRAKTATRQFSKRQMTWFRGQLRADATLETQYSESLRHQIFSIVRRFLLTAVE